MLVVPPQRVVPPEPAPVVELLEHSAWDPEPVTSDVAIIYMPQERVPYVRRSAYETVGGHEAVKNQFAEDVVLMRLLKARGFVTRFFMGAHLASTRMHSGLRGIFNGWARIFSGTARRRPSHSTRRG